VDLGVGVAGAAGTTAGTVVGQAGITATHLAIGIGAAEVIAVAAVVAAAAE